MSGFSRTSSSRTVHVRTSLLRGPVPIAIALIAAGAVYLGLEFTWRQAALFLVGAGAGLVLYHSAFGFTSAWRALIADGRGGGLRAQMLMLAVTSAIFLPLLADGQVFGRLLRGTVAPVGLSVIVGAFIFGVGMQLGGGCASGTLYSAGGGSVRMLVTLAAFIAGSVIGVIHMPMWEAAPASRRRHSLATLGLAPAMAASFGLFGAVAAVVRDLERRRHGALEEPPQAGVDPSRSVAARRGRARACRDQRRHAPAGGPAVGRDVGVRALGIEDRRRRPASTSAPGRTGSRRRARPSSRPACSRT